MRARTILCSLAFILVEIQTGFGQEVVLRPKYQTGIQQVYNVETNIDQALTLNGSEIVTGVNSIEKRSVKVLDTSEKGTELQIKTNHLSFTLNLPGGVSVTFDSRNPDQKPQNPQMVDLFQLLKVMSQATSTISLDGQGDLEKVTYSGEGLDTLPDSLKDFLTEDRLKEQLKQEFHKLAADGVKPGDTWDRSEVFDAGQGQYFTYTTTYKYEGRVTKEGVEYDKVTASYAKPKFDIAAGSPIPLTVKSSDLSMKGSEATMLSEIDRGGLVKQTATLNYKGALVFVLADGSELPAELDLKVTSQINRQP